MFIVVPIRPSVPRANSVSGPTVPASNPFLLWENVEPGRYLLHGHLSAKTAAGAPGSLFQNLKVFINNAPAFDGDANSLLSNDDATIDLVLDVHGTAKVEVRFVASDAGIVYSGFLALTKVRDDSSTVQRGEQGRR